jgi:hypothetical protein
MDEASITIKYKRGNDGRAYFDIQVPKDQRGLGVEDSTMILSAGISLLIKAGHKRGDVKDYELLEKVIEYMRSEFVSTDSFEDSYIHPGTLKEK